MPSVAHERAPVGSRLVLFVDDNKAAADMLARVVSMLGNDVRTTGDGLQAPQVGAEFHPEVVLMDIGMPKMDGYEAAREIRATPWGKGVTLVALTAWGQEEAKRRAAEAGFDRHLVKPEDLAVLAAISANAVSF